MDKKVIYTFYSLTAGSCAAVGSLLGKLAGSYDSWALAVSLYIVMISVNSIGFMLFAKSLNFSQSSLQPTLISAASSFIFSAVIDSLAFGAILTKFWWFGTVFVIAGMFVLSFDKKKID